MYNTEGSGELPYIKRIIHLMGATIDISLVDSEDPSLLDAVEERLHTYNMRFSANDARSELMQVNLQAGLAPVTVHPELFELIQLGRIHSLAPGSHLNIAIGPLVQTWRIGFKDARVPSPQEIQAALALTDPANILMDEDKLQVKLALPGMKLDLGALAKGYIADRLKDFLLAQGVQSALIDLGGNILTIGQNQDRQQAWQIGIQNPLAARGQHLMVLPIVDQSVVTSGIYERTLSRGGQTYHHILDRQTGYPMTSPIASLTIIAQHSVDCEIWTTRLFGDMPSDILAQVEAQTGLEAVLVTQDQHIYHTSGLKRD